MKKLLLISALFAAGISTASAQLVKGPGADFFKDRLKKEMLSNEPLNMKLNACPFNVKRANLPGTRADLNAYYGRPEGTFLAGYYYDEEAQRPLQYVPCFVGSANLYWQFRNYSTEGMTYSWTMNGQDIVDNNIGAVDEAGNMTLLPGIGSFYMPELNVSNGKQSVSYKYGSDVNDNQAILCSDQMLPITCLDFHYSYYTSLVDENNNYFPAFGSGHFAGNEEQPIMDGFAGKFKPMSPLYINNIWVYLVSGDGTPTYIMPTDGTLDLEIRKLDEEGNISTEVVATAQMNGADLFKFQDFQGDQSALYVAPFYFMETDPVTGLKSQYNLVMSEPFAVVIGGYNKPGYNLNVLFGNELIPGASANGAYRVEGSESFHPYPTSPDDPTNLYNIGIQLYAINPTLYIIEPSRTVYVPAEGGVASFKYSDQEYEFIQVNSAFPLEQDDETCVWMDEVPSWLTIEADDELYADEHNIMFVVTGEPLPDGVDGRRATLVFRSFGVEAWANVLQERIPGAAIDQNSVSVVKAVQNGENFDLTYPEDVNAVTVLNAAGQTIATYELPANGQFSMPAANLAKGLYILKFNGEKTAGVKIMK